MKKLLLISFAALSLTACATTPTVYQPINTNTAIGYSEIPIEQDRWRVTFRGGPGADPARVADLALRRAAELTVARGYDWFRVTQRYSDGRAGGGPVVSLGAGGASFGGGSAFGLGGGVGFDLGGGPRVSQTLEILMNHGAAPREPDAYDARAVIQSMGQHS